MTSVRLELDSVGRLLPVPLEGKLRVGVVKRNVAPPAQGVLDVVMTFDASSNLEAASAPTDPALARLREKLAASLADAGIALGNVEYRDNASQLQTPIELGSACLTGQVSEVFDSVAPAPGALHLVFVDAFACKVGEVDVGASLAGLSNGTPGLPFATKDGVLIATWAKDEYPEDWALVGAHEAGHFLGLFHTAEPIPGIFDNIPDTDEANSDDYLMFYNVTLSGSTLISEEQAWVIRQHPLIH
jgi:hypothetical protein